MDEKILEKLTKPFPKSAIKQREGGGGKRLDYVEGHTVIHRLNSLGVPWHFEIVGDPHFQVWGTSKRGGEQILVTVHGRLTIDNLGSRDGMGVQVATIGSSEDLIKGAETDALKKAATKFGVALDLYGDNYEVDVKPTPKQRLSALLRANGIKSQEQANKASLERFEKGLDELVVDQVQLWIEELERKEPTPF